MRNIFLLVSALILTAACSAPSTNREAPPPNANTPATAAMTEADAIAKEKAIWDKYINQVINRDASEEQGYFWAVTEAKVIEGSAVVMGSNYATPTISVTGNWLCKKRTRH